MMPVKNASMGILGAVGGLENYRVEQRPDGTYVVVEITAEDLKREIQSRIDPQFAPFVNVVPSPRGFRVEVRI